MNRSHSSAAYALARRLIPGGVNSPARAFGAVGGEPIFFERAGGAYLYDLDGNRYLDYVGSWGPMILGHRHPAVVEAVKGQADRAFSFGAPTEAESELAQLIIAAIPSIEQIRFVSSGTEATMSAIRLARGATGREVIVKFAGNYHGHADSLLVAAGSSAATLGVPNSPGVTLGTSRDTLVLPYNDPNALAVAFAEHGQRIAGVIFEPIVGNMGTILPSEAFVVALRSITRQYGALLICDEVMTGFRVAHGGAQSILGIHPDLTTLGKIIGGGLPLAAYGGRADLMAQVLPAGKVFQAGTLSGNPLATAAGIATLKLLADGQVYRKLEQLGAMLADGLHAAAAAAGIPHQVARSGSMLTLFFHDKPVIDWQTASQSDTQCYARFFWGMADRGIYLPCSQFEAMFVSAAHTESDVQYTIDTAHEVMKRKGRERVPAD